MQKTSTFLMFVGDKCGKAQEAIEFYVSLFPDSHIAHIEKYSADEPGGQEGLVKKAAFTLSGTEYLASENTFPHQFNFTPSISIFVNCADESELASLFEKLSEGGSVMMPVGDYGFSKQFGWLADRYGVSWQLNVE